MTKPTLIFVCPYCDKRIRYRVEQDGHSGKCPGCGERVYLINSDNPASLDSLRSEWFYRQPRLLISSRMEGPVADDKFLKLVERGEIQGATEIMSPQRTSGEWISLADFNVSRVQCAVRQRDAEGKRKVRELQKKTKREAANRARLRRAIREALEGGGITVKKKEQVIRLGEKFGIPHDEIDLVIATESEELLREIFEDALSDGILEPEEESQISQTAAALGVQLSFSENDTRRIALCRLAYSLDTGTFLPRETAIPPFKLARKEEVVKHCFATWYDVVALKRPAGIPLGGGYYLKMQASGECYLTTKKVTLIGALKSHKFTLTSVERAMRYQDGVFFNRSSGKSVFIELDTSTVGGGEFALLTEFAVTNEPVLGHDPEELFVPLLDESEENENEVSVSTKFEILDAPRYTFRVVGDHVGRRSEYIDRLKVGDGIVLVAEPSNPYDENAVAVYDLRRHQLGYLKRDVARWFCQILSRDSVQATAHAFTESGSLIVGVYI